MKYFCAKAFDIFKSDLASLRTAMVSIQKDPSLINPCVPVDLVIDHSVQADVFGKPDALQKNMKIDKQSKKTKFVKSSNTNRL